MNQLISLSSVLLASAAVAQPSHIILHLDQSTELVYEEHNVSDTVNQNRTTVPVFSELGDGTLVPGVYYRGSSQSGFHAQRFPAYVTQLADGSWEIEWVRWSVIHGPKNQKWERKIHRSEFAQIVHQNAKTQQVSPLGGPTFLWSYDHDGAPSGFTESVIEQSISNAIDSYRELFKDDGVLFSEFSFSWVSLGPGDNTVARALLSQSDRSLSFVRTNIFNTYAANSQDTDFFENGLYANFPTGSNIQYAEENGSTDQTASILTPQPLLTKFTGIPYFTDLRIEINADIVQLFPLDADPSDGIVGIDLTGTLVHELGHHFGFSSNLEALDFPLEDSLTLWDIFRMGAALGSISPNEFFGQRRELRTTEEANAALQINSLTWAVGLSRGTLTGGDGNQSSHWKDDDITGVYIGIMDPSSSGGSEIVDGRYLQSTDIRAFDVMGYTIDAGDFMPVQVPNIISPAGDVEVDPALPLQFEWNPQSGTTSSDILIYDLGTTISNSQRQGPNPPLVFRSDGISGGSLTVLNSELPLLQGHRYQWHAAVYHPMGVNLTDPATFIAACLADLNNDGILNFIDVSAFVAAFQSQNPSADFNNDGTINFTDVSAFIAAFQAGCP